MLIDRVVAEVVTGLTGQKDVANEQVQEPACSATMSNSEGEFDDDTDRRGGETQILKGSEISRRAEECLPFQIDFER